MPSVHSITRSAVRFMLALLVLVGVAACESGTLPNLDGRTPDATVSMSMVHAAFIGSGSGGSGTLNFRGRTFPFTIVGGGVGGIGGSTVQADGEVFGLRDVSQFPGTWAQARAGFAFGTASSGQLWLQNTNGVIMRVNANRTGLMLSLGADAIVITMNQ